MLLFSFDAAPSHQNHSGTCFSLTGLCVASLSITAYVQREWLFVTYFSRTLFSFLQERDLLAPAANAARGAAPRAVWRLFQ